MNHPVLTQPSIQPAVDAPSAAATPAALPAAPAVETVPLTEVLRQIRADSRREPQQYLDETAVPYGGD